MEVEGVGAEKDGVGTAVDGMGPTADVEVQVAMLR